MTEIYRRETPHAPVFWSPQDEEAGKEAITNICGEADSYPVKVNAETAEKIRDEYDSLIGGSA